MRWVLWLVVALMTMHHLAMTAMPLAVASPMPMAQASIAHPQPCSATAVQQAPEPCLESCSILHATTLSRAAATAPSPTASAGHTIDPGRSAVADRDHGRACLASRLS